MDPQGLRAGTCSPTIELPITYAKYLEFAHDFTCVLHSEYVLFLDKI